MLEDEEIREVYEWIDQFPITKVKRNFARDFSDAIPLAEIMKSYHPSLVQLHSYSQVNSTQAKLNNWDFMNKKIFKKIGFEMYKEEPQAIVNIEEMAIEKLLLRLKRYLEASAEELKTKIKEDRRTMREQVKERLIKMKKGDLVHFDSTNQKDVLVNKLQQTVSILEEKINKLKMQAKVKDDKINLLSKKLREAAEERAREEAEQEGEA